jgi:NADH:ubiquinone oxidoreductase subunit F (NADH-binding)/NAD-dependent dihydropyrimidine dehydrogenase PreA subunit
MGGSAKYVVCNADEGDPRASMARTVLEGDPFRVIEGLVIAGYAVGAGQGILHVRGADRVALDRARAAVRSAEQERLLGEGILGTGFRFRLEIIESASSACGDEGALIRAIEAQRGAPASSRPDAARVEPGGQAALVTDIETVAALPWVLRRGPEAFAALGTERSKGTRVLSLTGKISREGLVEVPMGTTIREVVQEIGGGIPGNRSFKAVLAGGPFGVCIPAALADTRVGDEFLSPDRGIVGSGGLVVLDDADCIVEIVRRSLRSTQKEYCRTCSVARVNVGGMLEILDRICKGTCEPGDLETLEQLGLRIRQEATCGPGHAVPNLVLTTLASFRDEYEAHVRERRCPAAACRSLVHYRVLDSCSGCTLCAQVCPLGAIEARPYLQHEVIDDRCTRCGLCVTACPEQAIDVV